nr:MAG TPA: hypothetical protein [Caudoviricetes sp.]
MNLVLSNNNLSVCFNQHPFRYHLFGGYQSGYLPPGYRLAQLLSRFYIRDIPACTLSMSLKRRFLLF